MSTQPPDRRPQDPGDPAGAPDRRRRPCSAKVISTVWRPPAPPAWGYARCAACP